MRPSVHRAVVLLAVMVVGSACTALGANPPTAGQPARPDAEEEPAVPSRDVTEARTLEGVSSWTYQLQRYRGGRLDDVVAAPHDLVVIDLARDADEDMFTPGEIQALHDAGKVVLAYFEIGSIETYRPEYAPVRSRASDLVLNRWEDWPDEYFVRYWDERWWDMAVRPRIDQAVRAGFDGLYMDTPLAYEELDLALVPGASRASLARRMAALIVRISMYGKAQRPGLLVVPQNSPELRLQPGYTDAIDAIAMEELFFLATDEPCTQDWCAENLGHTRALRDAGKVVLAVDYASQPDNVAAACRRDATEGFVGNVTTVELDRVAPPCT